MSKKTLVTPATNQAEISQDWYISVVEILELDPWKFFHQSIPISVKVKI
ncbi:hypothetical protein VB715_21655 [Crocosphaera sp. UHCC 0190]|nr:hypothetical protein [Crocosphaera sp. UHCC 0190]MEA5512381.1 hypothetical protein [Crocosphaera sp. UHCC 0190]